jgi:hypothetical protein
MSPNMEVSRYKINYRGCGKSVNFFLVSFGDLDFSLCLEQD